MGRMRRLRSTDYHCVTSFVMVPPMPDTGKPRAGSNAVFARKPHDGASACSPPAGGEPRCVQVER